MELPQHGETKIITHQGKVKRVKFDEGEEFWKIGFLCTLPMLK
jgi:hypothetical protein